jgi:hypothetical protein
MHYVIGVVTGMLVALGIMIAVAPHCPTEDSCKPDYIKVNVGPVHFGYWTGMEG